MTENFCDFKNVQCSSYFTITYTLLYLNLIFCFKVPRLLIYFKFLCVHGVKRLKDTWLITCTLMCSITEASQFFTFTSIPSATESLSNEDSMTD